MSDRRDELLGTLGRTICNCALYPQKAQPHLLGADMSRVLDSTADALLDAGYRKPSPWIPADIHDGGGYKAADEKDIPWLLVNREWLLSEVRRLTPRTVSTSMDLDALPEESAVALIWTDGTNAVILQKEDGYWWPTKDSRGYTSAMLWDQRAGATLTVLHVGGDR